MLTTGPAHRWAEKKFSPREITNGCVPISSSIAVLRASRRMALDLLHLS